MSTVAPQACIQQRFTGSGSNKYCTSISVWLSRLQIFVFNIRMHMCGDIALASYVYMCGDIALASYVYMCGDIALASYVYM